MMTFLAGVNIDRPTDPESWVATGLEKSEKRGVQATRNGPSPPPTPAGGPVAKPEMRTADRLGSRERREGARVRLFQQPDLENHWEPMRNLALPSVMAFVAQATHPAGALLRDRQCAA